MRLTKKNKLFLLISLGTGLVLLSCKKEEGLIKSDQVEKWTYFSTDNGLPSNQINCLAEDSSHNIWIGTNKGLAKFDGTNFTCYSLKDGLPSDSIYSLFCASNQELFVGTHNGFGKITGTGQYAEILNELDEKCVNFSENKQKIFCSTYFGYYVYYFSSQTYEWGYIDTTSVNGIIYVDPVTNIVFRQNKVYVAGEKGVYIINGNDMSLYSNKTLGMSSVNQLFKDKSDNIWLTSLNDNTVKCFNGTEFNDVTLFPLAKKYKAFIQDRYNNYWVSLYGYGVLNYGGGMSKMYNTASSSIQSNNINALFFDSKNNLWLGSNDKGLMCFKNIKPLQFDTGINSGSNPALNNNY
jgi:Two component regulator propeller.